MAIVKANYRPRGKTGQMGRALAYYTFRQDRAHPEAWYSGDERTLSYAEARAEIGEQIEAVPYTYRVVLSTREAALDVADYREVLQEHFGAYYFAEHHNGDHPHAHAVAFSDRRLDAGALRSMREALGERERERERVAVRSAEQERGWDDAWER